MTGASDRHEEIATNLLAILHSHLKGSGCRIYGSNLKIRVGDDFLYPDLFVRCATERGDPFFKTDPTLVIEVLSPSTRSYDRGDKRLVYQSLVTLQEYVLVTQDTPSVEIYRRPTDGWKRETYQGPGESLSFQSVALDIELSDALRKLTTDIGIISSSTFAFPRMKPCPSANKPGPSRSPPPSAKMSCSCAP
ncbi:Uma2 family endonuclease [Candidatus Thiosymbion oneisti]|uniref:Uma2 family endonuclease n=1 Tax=Candidatus Thiosymbion oneisti TaxID=589554 RepID=UPI00114CAA4B